MFRIGDFSKMAKTTIKTLRYYDEIGILKPEKTDQFTGYRFYTSKQLLQFHKILSYRQAGLSAQEIKFILSGQDEKKVLDKRKEELLSLLSETSCQISRIEFILQGKEDLNFMNYVATIKELPECIVYSKRMTVPNYDAYFEVIPKLGEKVEKKYPDLKCTNPAYCFIVYLDGEYREKDINIEFCEAIDQIKPDFDGVVFKKIESTTAVSVFHKGPYQGFRQAYAFIFKWIEENGYKIKEAPRESYIDGIWNKESEEDWLTELQIPIVKE